MDDLNYLVCTYTYLRVSSGLRSRIIFFGPASDLFFQAAPAPSPDIFPKRLRLLEFLFSSGTGTGAKGMRPLVAPAPALDYWLRLAKYVFPCY